MYNLFDGIKKVAKPEAVNQLAEMETYSAGQYVSVLLCNIYYKFISFLALFIPACRNKKKSMALDSLETRFENNIISCDGQNEAVWMSKAKGILRKKAGIISFKYIKRNLPDDMLSSEITRGASHILKKREKLGRSIYEINDIIFQEYPKMRKPGNLAMLRIWLAGSVLLCALFLFGIKISILPIPFMGIAFAVSELFLGWFMCRRMAVWQLAHFTWLAASGIGGFCNENHLLPVNRLPRDVYEKISLRMKGLHTMLYSLNAAENEYSVLNGNIQVLQMKIEQNNKIIQTADKKKENEADAIRIKNDKREENRRLQEDIKEEQKKLQAKDEERRRIQELAEELEESLKQDISRIWTKNFPQLTFHDGMIKDAVSFFTIEDFERIEQRLFEIYNTENPQALAEKKNGLYRLAFITVQGDIGGINFAFSGTDRQPVIQSIDRKGILQEPFVTNEELKQILEGIKKENSPGGHQKEIEKQKEWYKEQLNKWNDERKKLAEENSRLENEKGKLLTNLDEKQSEIDSLADKIQEKETECRQLQARIKEYTMSGDSVQAGKAKQVMEQYKNQLSELQDKYNKRLSELQDLYAEIETLAQQQTELIRQLNKKETELKEADDRIGRLELLISENKQRIQEYKDRVQEKDNQITTLNSLVKKSEKAHGVDKETIRKLKNSQKQLEDEKSKLEKEMINCGNLVEELTKEGEDNKKQLEIEKKQIEELKKSISGTASQILYDEEIYTKLYEQIRAAQEYIYIVSPFVRGLQFKNMQKKLESASRSNPDLKIKICYGMKDTNFSGQLWDPQGISESRKSIEQLQQCLKNKLTIKETNTHVKLVIVDDREFLLGSANLMSFGGNYRNEPGLHSEIAICSRNKEQIKELKKKYFNW